MSQAVRGFILQPTYRIESGRPVVHLFGRPDLFAASVSDLTAMAGRGEIRPVIGKTFPFEQAGEAQTFLQSRASTGKVVLVRD